MEYSIKEAKALGIIGCTGLGFVNPKSAFKKINQQILQLIKGGELVYRKPWRDGYKIKGVTYGPQNYVTQNPYHGYNAWLINFMNITSGEDHTYFLTLKQIKERGGKLKKNAVPYPVHAFIKSEKVKTNDKTGKEELEEYTGWVDYIVYPVDHVTGLKPITRRVKKDEADSVEIIVDAETIVSNMPKAPEIRHGGNKAFYSPSADHVQMPVKKSFKNIREYYSVLFHELIHSTGNKKRIGREFGTKFGSKVYAFEELIAELGAAYLCGVSEIDYYTVNNSAAYLKSWSRTLATEIEKDHTFLFRAVYAAAKAAKYIIGTTLEKKGTKGTQLALFGPDDKGVHFISEYAKLHNTIVTEEQALKLLDELQDAISGKQIRSSHPFAADIVKVQSNLITLCRYTSKHGPTQVLINPISYKRYNAIIGGELNGFAIPFVAAAAGKLIEMAVEKKFGHSIGSTSRNGKKGKRKKKEQKRDVKPEKRNNSALNGIDVPGFVRADQKPVEKPADVFRLPGEMGKFLQDLQWYRGMILLTGDPHAGKTEFAFQLADSFAEAGEDIGYFSLEQGGLESKDTQAAITRNLKEKNRKHLHISGEAPKGLDSVKEVAKHFRVVIVDSWQKLGEPSTQLDSLRQEYPNTFFIVIFQQNGEGGTRGGVAADYDTPIKIKVHKVDSTFKNNYAELQKNRGNSLNVKYLIASKKTVPLLDEVKEEKKSKAVKK